MQNDQPDIPNSQAGEVTNQPSAPDEPGTHDLIKQVGTPDGDNKGDASPQAAAEKENEKYKLNWMVDSPDVEASTMWKFLEEGGDKTPVIDKYRLNWNTRTLSETLGILKEDEIDKLGDLSQDGANALIQARYKDGLRNVVRHVGSKYHNDHSEVPAEIKTRLAKLRDAVHQKPPTATEGIYKPIGQWWEDK